tara:strand:- start:4949 stop:5614 length:666 start_codon:yes stop_codon:yes gene_type:complete
LDIIKFDIYRNPNIGVFFQANDNFLISPPGIASTKISKIIKHLKVENISTTIGGSRLLGALTIMNSNGIIVSKLIEGFEEEALKKETGLPIQKLDSRFTSAGNLIAANDYGAIVSSLIGEEEAKNISKILKVPVKRMNIASMYLMGAMIKTTNTGAVAHPIINENNLKIIRDVLQVDIKNATVNSGVPYVSSGIISNSENILVGNQTSGPELVMVSSAFGI